MTSFLTSTKALKGLVASAALGAATLAIPGAAQAAIVQINFGPATWASGSTPAPNNGATYSYTGGGTSTYTGNATGSYKIDTATGALSDVSVTFDKFFITNTNAQAGPITFNTGSITSGNKFQASTNYLFSNGTKSLNLKLNNTQLQSAGVVTWAVNTSQFCQAGNGTSCNKTFTGVGGLSTSVPFPAPLLGVAPFALMALRKRNPFAKAKQAVQLATAAV